jgi:hypothetical protein
VRRWRQTAQSTGYPGLPGFSLWWRVVLSETTPVPSIPARKTSAIDLRFSPLRLRRGASLDRALPSLAAESSGRSTPSSSSLMGGRPAQVRGR